MIAIGKIAKPVGLKGEFRFILYSKDIDRMKSVEKLYVDQNEYSVDSLRSHNGVSILKLGGINSIEDVEPLRHKEVYIPEKTLPPLSDGEYYVKDLEGMKVLDVDGTVYGKINYVNQSAAQDIYEIKTQHGLIMIPAVKEYIKTVDIASNIMTVDIPKELINLNRTKDEN